MVSPFPKTHSTFHVLGFGFGFDFLHGTFQQKIPLGNAPESVKSFIESRKNSIDEDAWFPLAAAFNSCYLADSKRGRKSAGGWWLVMVISMSFPRKSKNLEKEKEFLSNKPRCYPQQRLGNNASKENLHARLFPNT